VLLSKDPSGLAHGCLVGGACTLDHAKRIVMRAKQKYDIVEYDTDPGGAGGTFKTHVKQILKKAFRRSGIYVYQSPPPTVPRSTCVPCSRH
jgi:hypothetical protein